MKMQQSAPRVVIIPIIRRYDEALYRKGFRPIVPVFRGAPAGPAGSCNRIRPEMHKNTPRKWVVRHA